MEVNGTKTICEMVTISDLETKRVAVEAIMKAFNIPDSKRGSTVLIVGDDLVERVTYYTSHSFTEDEFIRKATEEDKAAMLVIRKLGLRV